MISPRVAACGDGATLHPAPRKSGSAGAAIRRYRRSAAPGRAGASISITVSPSPADKATSARWIGPKVRTCRTAPSSTPLPAGPTCMSWRRTNSFEAPEAAPSAAIFSGLPPSRTQPSSHLYRQHDRFADEAVHEGGRGIVVDLAGRADLLDTALVHHHHPVGDFERFFLIVGDEDRGHVDLVMQRAQPLPQFLAHLGVERAERLVEQQNARLDRQRTRQRDALALAAGQLARIAAGKPVELHQIEQFLDAGADRRLRPCGPRAAAPAGRTRRFRTPSCGGTARNAGTQIRHGARRRRGRARSRRRTKPRRHRASPAPR